jgi:hypothetical protein
MFLQTHSPTTRLPWVMANALPLFALLQVRHTRLFGNEEIRSKPLVTSPLVQSLPRSTTMVKMNTMLLIRYFPLLLLTLPFLATAQHSQCPQFSGASNNVLVNARLFDGPVAEQVELVPDNEHGATWDVKGYKTTGRTLVLLCEYKNHMRNFLLGVANKCLGLVPVLVFCCKKQWLVLRASKRFSIDAVSHFANLIG